MPREHPANPDRDPDKRSETLLPEVYDELRRYVRARITRNGNQAFDATDVVHEVYLRLAEKHHAEYQDQRHFFAVAAQCVRRVLVDHARRAAAERRGGNLRRTTLDSRVLGAPAPIDVLDLDAALEALAADHPRCVEVVELRFFGGLSIPEAAARLEVSTATIERDWRYARAFLYERLALG